MNEPLTVEQIVRRTNEQFREQESRRLAVPLPQRVRAKLLAIRNAKGTGEWDRALYDLMDEDVDYLLTLLGKGAP